MKGFCGVLIVVAALATSCATATVKGESAAGEGTPDPSIDFFNAGSFDRKMSSALRGKPQAITVNLVAPTTLNTIPERLGSWLTMVEKNDGTVQLQDDSKVQTRALFDPVSMVLAAFSLFKAIGDKFMYSPVAGYNATIHYEEGGRVSKIVFTRKE